MVISSFLLLFARAAGFFFFSPLFSELHLSTLIRFGLSVTLTLLFAPLFLSQSEPMIHFLPLALLQEGIIGYLLGFLFSLLFETVALAGNVVGTMMGINVANLFAPPSLTTPLLSKAFVLLAGALLFSLDLHHFILRTFYDSYTLFPTAKLSFQNIDTIVAATSSIFKNMVGYISYPLFFLGAVLVILAIASRLFPDLPILWMGFPLQLLVGFIATLAGLSHFPSLVENTLFQLRHFIDHILSPLLQ